MRQFTILLLALISATLIANADVTGKVSNEQGEPIMGASLVLLELPDSTYVSGSVTSADGTFSISSEKPSGSYMLRVQSFGYEPSELGIDAKDTHPLDIVLKMASTELSEVVVRGKSPVTTREGGKFIFIPNDLANDVSSARNLMNHVPLVQWTDRQVSILGKGASKVYLNGKDPHWSTIEVSSMLQTLDPHYIKRVEIITEPGASQAASYTGGIINIIYDDPSQGMRGNMLVNAGLNDDNPNVWPNLWLNYQKNKFKASLNLSYYYNHEYSHTTDSYDYLTLKRQVTNDSKNTSFNNSLTGKLNLSYDLTPRSVVGASISLGTMRTHSKSTVNTVTRDEAGNEESSTMRQTQDSRPDNPYILALAYYTLNLDNKGSMIDILAGYGRTASHTDINNVFSGTSMPQLLENDQYEFSGKADFIKVFNPTTRLMAGVEFSDLHLTDTQTFEGVFDKFKYYDRQLHAYLQFSRRWNNYISTDIGLRVENTHTQGHQLQDEQTDTRDYTDLFPSFSMSWNIPKGNQSLSLSYERNISRPRSQMLNPYKTWSSDNTYSQGNPYLKPEYSDVAALSYSFLNKYIFSTRYFYSSQLSTAYTLSTPEGQTVSSFTNSGRSHYVSLGFSYNTSVGGFWRLDAYAGAFYRNIKTRAEGHNIHTSGWDFSLTQGNTFIISRRHFLMAILNHTLTSPTNRGTYKEDWRYVIRAAVQKSFSCGLGGTLSVGIPVTGYKNVKTLVLPDYTYRNVYNGHRYSIDLSLTYTFGKSRVQGALDRSDELKK